MKSPSPHFNRKENCYIAESLDDFIRTQVAGEDTLTQAQIYQALGVLIDEFGCRCRLGKENQATAVELTELLEAYRLGRPHPPGAMNAVETDAVLDEYCCPVPQTILFALLDTLFGRAAQTPELKDIYRRAGELLPAPAPLVRYA